MTEEQKRSLIEQSWDMHALVEASYLKNSATLSTHDNPTGHHDWLEKQRLLLADMALHLFQTSLEPEPMELDKLRNNLHAILTISDQFLPDAKLDRAKDHLY
ncbi:hypothetical protein DU002_11560 [Corallincola holothuriorum]|uniref:Uncharacterized protein n=1 Tax=Corallincola holothuriorum TaxID=2282215 RepID=A0A368NFX6_9GAMM|nr:hypothetical protein [Corallincola holothuriorum]RCU49547.1 hypothetical protein DU002_11560 [Corallincola holothuriorum]